MISDQHKLLLVDPNGTVVYAIDCVESYFQHCTGREAGARTQAPPHDRLLFHIAHALACAYGLEAAPQDLLPKLELLLSDPSVPRPPQPLDATPGPVPRREVAPGHGTASA